MPPWPAKPYGDNPELDLIELGKRAAFAYDELFSIEKRLCKANGLPTDPVRRQGAWIEAQRTSTLR
jgi:hypothetical protein